MQSPHFSVTFSAEEPLIRDLSRSFAATIRDVEAGDRGYAVPGAAQGFSGVAKAKTEGANDPHGSNGDTGSVIYFVKSVKTRHVPVNSPAILVAFPIEALYTMSPKGENSSSEVRRLSHEKQSAAI